MKGVLARRLAVEALTKVERDDAFASIALSSAFDRHQLSERDRAFAVSLVQGVLRHRLQLDDILAKLSSQPLAKMAPALRNTLRVGLFQLESMSDIPPSAVLNTSVEVGKLTGHAGSGKFVNGVLRAYLRARQQAAEPDEPAVPAVPEQDNSATALSTSYSMPLWLTQKWLEERGLDETLGLLRFCQTVPKLTIRTCETAITTAGLKGLLENKGLVVTQGKLVDSCLTIEDRGKYKGKIEKIPGYQEGLFSVQDEAAAFVSKAVAAEAGELVIDLCAAPGGKTVHLAEMMENKGRVLAVDISDKRLNMLRQTRQRLGLTNIEIVAADATTFVSEKPADRVLLDAPCSGTGVINRRGDLRHRRQPLDLPALVDLQRRLLNSAAGLVKPGGILVYATCSLEKEENEDNLRWFLATHKEFEPDSLLPYATADFQAGPAAGELGSGSIQLLPTRHGVSGFFLARLRKSGSAASN